MQFVKKALLPVLLATIWISISEFVRNQFLLKSYWTNHYQDLGLTFPSEPLNGAVWGIWALAFSIIIFVIAKRFSFVETSLIAWTAGFLLMWLVIGNMSVLPFGILFYAVPLSLIEVFVAVFIIKKFQK